jgi:hypothetical protein
MIGINMEATVTSQQANVVTLERFQQGLTWEQWLSTAQVNRERLEANYRNLALAPDEVAIIKRLIEFPRGPNVWGVGRHAPGKILALAEPWCIDCVLTVPVVARLCQATGMELRLLSREENQDIMREFLLKGEFQAIPTLVFFTRSHEFLGYWIEKTLKARDEESLLAPLLARLESQAQEVEEREKVEEELEAFLDGPVWHGWQRAQVTEIRMLLEDAMEIGRRLDDIRDMLLND